MSSIISDIFYGSKQNLLDNYLIHRFDKEPSVSGPQQNLQKMTAVYSSALHFTITIPVAQDFQQKNFAIKVQLGKKIQEVFATVGGKKHPYEILVELNDLDNVDLSKYSNIKITVSEGKYKEKVFGYIPIQTIKSIIAQQGGQKTITLPVKGKRFIGFKSIKCNIKADFSQYILNSNILGSIDKDNSGISHLNFRSRENELEETSGIQEESQNLQTYKITNVRKYVRRDVQKSNLKSRNQSSSYIIEKHNYHKNIQNKLKSTNQFIKQILPVPAIFGKIKLNKINYAQENIKLSQNGVIFTLGQEVKLSNITQQGVNVDLYVDEIKIGRVHLNALFLMMTDFKGELPIYDQNQKCVGTILVCSPGIYLANQTVNWKLDKGKQTQITKREEFSLQQKAVAQRDMYNLLVLSIKKIVMTNLSKELINESLHNVNQLKAEYFQFVKIEACGRLELILKINQQIFSFNDISLRYVIDTEQIQVVQLRRRQGFTITSCQHTTDRKGDQNVLEMELYSNHRLLSYSKTTLSEQTIVTHHFTAAETGFAFSQSAIYYRCFQLQAHQEYFQMNRLSQIMNIIQQLIDGQLRLLDLSDESIKYIMKINKKIAYVEVKKLFNLIQPHFNQFMEFQQTSINTVFGEQPFRNDLVSQMNSRLLRQFVLLDVKNESSIDYEQFQKIVKFFMNQSVLEIQQSCNKLMTKCIKNREGRVLYPFFAAGLYLRTQTIQNQQKNQPTHQNNPNINLPGFIVQKPQQVVADVIVMSQQRHFLQSIQFRNLHLLNLRKIPNVTLNIAIKIHYSNANPEFIIDKEINVMDPIKIYHKNIAQNSMQLLAEFMPSRRRNFYQLDPSGKVTAKMIWGN